MACILVSRLKRMYSPVVPYMFCVYSLTSPQVFLVAQHGMVRLQCTKALNLPRPATPQKSLPALSGNGLRTPPRTPNAESLTEV